MVGGAWLLVCPLPLPCETSVLMRLGSLPDTCLGLAHLAPRRMRLKFTPIEDATLGFWLMPMELRHIDHRRFFTWAAPCCFKAPKR